MLDFLPLDQKKPVIILIITMNYVIILIEGIICVEIYLNRGL